MHTVYTLYFSPTKSSGKLACTVADSLAQTLTLPRKDIDLTSPTMRTRSYAFDETDIVVVAYPVYGGRVPLLLEPVFAQLNGGNAIALVLAVYGNRAFEDALLEGANDLTTRGFRTIGGGAFIAEHSYSEQVGAFRPDRLDLSLATAFGVAAAQKIERGDTSSPTFSGNTPYKERMPAAAGTPLTKSTCNGCGACARRCPMGVIDPDNPFHVSDGCIRCCACVKCCVKHAKYFDDERMRQVTEMLTTHCTAPCSPETFL